MRCGQFYWSRHTKTCEALHSYHLKDRHPPARPKTYLTSVIYDYLSLLKVQEKDEACFPSRSRSMSAWMGRRRVS